MFVAQTAEQTLVTLRSHAQAAALPAGDYYCPSCGGELIVKNGQVLPAHFAHRGHACVPSEPESAVHMRGKLWLASLGERLGYTVALERWYPAIAQRADVVWERAGTTRVIEFQCSPLAGEKLAARTAGYASLGLACTWVLGAPYLSGQARRVTKFLQQDSAHGWHWWSFDGRTLVAHESDRLIGYTATRRWEKPRSGHDSPLGAARAVAKALHYREGSAMQLQAQAYAAGRNVAGVPWAVHLGLTHLPGLWRPEWAIRTAWLLEFEGRAITAAEEATWWAAQAPRQAVVTPLIDPATLLAAVRARWLSQLASSLQKTATGWRWRQSVPWYDSLEAKLADFSSD